MEEQPYHQLKIWDYLPSPIEIPKEKRKRLADLLAELLSGYWENLEKNRNRKKE